MASVRWLRGPSAFDEISAEWDQLLQSDPNATPFQSLAWHRSYATTYQTWNSIRILTLWEGADLVALWPLAVKRGPWRVLRSHASGPSDYLDPLIRPGTVSIRDLIEALASGPKVDLVDLHQLRESLSQLAEPEELGGVTLRGQARCLRLDLPGTWDAYLGMLGKSLRYDVRRLDRSLFAEGKATIEDVGTSEVSVGLDILLEQHKRRWRAKGLPGAFLGRSVAFQRLWTTEASCRGWLRLGVLRLEGQAIGAIYAMALGDRVFFYQAGFDPAHGSVSPGTLLVAHTIRNAIESGARQFDFLRGDEGYKRRWKPQNEDRNVRMIFSRPGVRARAGLTWFDRVGDIEDKIRARLEGGGPPKGG